ncbi:MAG: esterase family protein [Planctomycetota bacterium]|nr:esterase family protein [Planctomycetota bacterium]
MAFIQASFFSRVLLKEVGLYAIVPEQGKGPFPVFYLLHGLSDDHTIWHRRTRIEWFVRTLPLIVVMPDGFRGFYTDNDDGPAYGRYLVEDVIGFAERTFPAAGKRSGRCIGGLSMGGYGSMRLALAHPELFVSAHSHSGALFNMGRPFQGERKAFLEKVFGKRRKGSAHDVFALAARHKRAGTRLPKLRIDCGLDDHLITHNREFHAYLEKLGVAHEYSEHPGVHNWDYWEEHIQPALRFHARALGIHTGEAVKRLGG